MRNYLAAGMACAALVTATLPASAADGRHGAFLGGAALGAVGGVLLGSALADRDRYYAPPPPPVYAPPCYWTRQRVPNQYDYGWHVERVRVCE